MVNRTQDSPHLFVRERNYTRGKKIAIFRVFKNLKIWATYVSTKQRFLRFRQNGDFPNRKEGHKTNFWLLRSF